MNIRNLAGLSAGLLLAALTACSSVSETTARQNEQKGPALTEEEKAAMTTEEKVALYNEQQEEDDQLVCRRERPVGTRMTRTVCRTRAEIEEERRAAQDAIQPAKGYNQGAGD
jgi:hypothetical protein